MSRFIISPDQQTELALWAAQTLLEHRFNICGGHAGKKVEMDCEGRFFVYQQHHPGTNERYWEEVLGPTEDFDLAIKTFNDLP